MRPPPSFGFACRLFHWSVALMTLALLVSGLPLLFPGLRDWVRGYDPRMGLRLHLALSLFLLAPVVVFLLGNRQALRAEFRQLLHLTRDDWIWLPRLPRYLLGMGEAGDQTGRYNAGQKLNAWVVLVGLIGLTLTGTLLWLEASPGFTMVLRWVHDGLSIVLGLLIAGHIFLATLHPRTRPGLRGILSGHVPVDWAARHYPRWMDGSPATREGGTGSPRRGG